MNIRKESISYLKHLRISRHLQWMPEFLKWHVTSFPR